MRFRIETISTVKDVLRKIPQALPAAPPMRAAFARAGVRYMAFIRRRYQSAARGDGTWPDLARSTKLARSRGGRLGHLKQKLASARFLSDSLEAMEAIEKERSRRRLFGLRVKLGEARTGEESRAIRMRIRRLLAKSGSDAAAKRRSASITSVDLGHFEILRDKGLLFNSLSVGSPGNIQEALPLGIRVGTAIQYAIYHQDPTTPGHPPERKILVPPDEATEEAMRGDLQHGLAESVKLIAKEG